MIWAPFGAVGALEWVLVGFLVPFELVLQLKRRGASVEVTLEVLLPCAVHFSVALQVPV